MKNYLNKPYNFFLNTNSSIVLRNVILEVEQFAVALISYSFFLNELILIFGIGIVLLIFQPKNDDHTYNIDLNYLLDIQFFYQENYK